MKASPLAHLSKWRRLAPVVALLVIAFALVVGPARQALAQDGPQAFAVYCETDNTLTLYKASDKPEAGGTYKDKAATQVFDIDESEDYFGESPFEAVAGVVEQVEVADCGENKITPLSMDHWFDGFVNLVEVDGWEYADTSQVTNMSYTFSHTDLSNGVSAPELDTSSVTTMSNMFSYNDGLASPDLSRWDVSKVTDMSYMFANCTALRAPKLSGWNPLSVTTMKQMFYQCTALTSLDFSGWNTPELKNLSYAFFQDAALTSLDFEDWSAPKIGNLQSTFNQCSALTELDLSSWGASKVTDTSSTFLGCTSLATLDLSGIGANGKYGYTFDQCAALSKVTFGEGWSFGDTRSLLPEAAGKLWYKADADGNPTGKGYTSDELAEAWDGATMAGTWVLSDAPAAELEAFAVYCETDKTLTLYKASDKPEAGGTYKDKAATQVFDIDEQATHFSASPFADVKDQVTKVIIAAPENADNKLTPKSTNRWFYNFSSLEQVDGWANADTSQVTDMSYMFYRCNLSKGLDAPNLNTSSVTDMSNMFYGCKGLSSATGPDLSHWDVSNVTDMSSMFQECSALQAPKTTGWNTSSVTSMSYMFSGCSSIVTFDLTPWDLSSVKFANYMFSGCSALTTITLPDEDMASLTNAKNMFNGCAALTTVNASTWVAPALTSASNMFYGCRALTSLDLSSLDSIALKDTDGMFCGCSALATLDLSGIGIAEKPIMSAMFTGCSALSKVTLGADWSFADDRGALPSVEGKLWYKADADGNPTGEGYTPDALAAAWDGATMAGTWVLSEPIAESGPEAFAVYCEADKTLTIYKANDKPKEGDQYNGKAATRVFDIDETADWFSQTPFYSAKDSIEKVIFAEPEDQNNKIAPVSMRKWFDSVIRLKSIEGWENVDGSNLTDMSYLFSGTRLASIDLSALKAPKLETIESMFGSCLELKTANLSGLVTASTTKASNLFLGCSNLESVDVSKWDTSGMKSMTSVFQRCRDLTELDLSSWTTTDAVNMKWMFNESGITKVTLGTGFSFGSGPSQTGLPDAKGCLWYKLDDSGSPVRPGYTGEELATSWDGSTMAGTWQLTTELEEPELKPVELTGLAASDSLTYGATLTVAFTPKSGDDVVASGTATLKLGNTVLATSDEPQEDGSFSLSYNSADKGVALGEQTLTVTFESTGYEAATRTVKTTLSAKELAVKVTSSLDKTWDGSDEVDGLAVELLVALAGDDVTVSATGAYASSNAGEQGVTLTLTLSGDDAAWYTVSAPTGLTGTISAADIVGKLSLSGTPAFGETLTATYEPTSGEQVSYTWTRDGQVIDGATGSTYTLTKEDVGAQIAVVATASDANHTGSVTSDAVTVAKAAQDAPVAPLATATSHTTIEVEALADSPAGAKAEYSIDGGRTWQTETTFTGLEPETEYTVIARYQELDTHGASEASEGTTVSTPAAPSEPDPDDPDTPDTPDPDEPDTPDTPDTPETPDPDKPADTKPSEQPKPEIPATGDAGAAAAVATVLAGAVALGLGAHRRRG